MGKDLDKFIKDKLEDRTFEFKAAYWEDALQLIEEQENKDRKSGAIFKWVLSLLLFAVLSCGVVYCIQKSVASYGHINGQSSVEIVEKQQQGIVEDVNYEETNEQHNQQINGAGISGLTQTGTANPDDSRNDFTTIEKNTASGNNTTFSNPRLSIPASDAATETSPSADQIKISTNSAFADQGVNFIDNTVRQGQQKPEKAYNNLTKFNKVNATSSSNSSLQITVESAPENQTEKPVKNEKDVLNKNQRTTSVESVNSEKTYPAKSADNDSQGDNNITLKIETNKQIQDNNNVSNNIVIKKLPTLLEPVKNNTETIPEPDLKNRNKPHDPFEGQKKKKHYAGIYGAGLINPAGVDFRDVLFGYKAGLISRFSISRNIGLRAELLYKRRNGKLPYTQSSSAKIYSFGSTQRNYVELPASLNTFVVGLLLDFQQKKHHFGIGGKVNILKSIDGNLAEDVQLEPTHPSANNIAPYLDGYTLVQKQKVSKTGFNTFRPAIQVYYGFDLTKNLQVNLRSSYDMTDLSNENNLAEESMDSSGLTPISNPSRLSIELGIGYKLFKF